MKILKVLIVLSSLIFTSLYADNDRDEKNHLYKNLDFLELNHKQYKEIKKILISFRKKYKDFYEYKEDQESKLEKIMSNNTFNHSLYMQIVNNIKSKATLLEANNLEKIHSVLNKKQRKKFAYYLEDWEVE